MLRLNLRGLQDVFCCPVCGKEIQESEESYEKRLAADPEHVNDVLPFCEHVALAWHSELEFITDEVEVEKWDVDRYDAEEDLIEKIQAKIEKDESNHFIFYLTGLPGGGCSRICHYSMILVIAWPEEFVREEEKSLQKMVAELNAT